jgi:protein-tyrosine phosphatase
VGRRLGARSPHGVDLAISANAKLLSYDRMKQRYDELGARDQFTAVTTMLASRGTTIKEPDLDDRVPDDARLSPSDGLSDTELAALHARLTS